MAQSDIEKSIHSTTRKGEEVAGQAKSAASDVKEAVVSGAASIDISGLRDEIAKLGQSVASLIQDQASSARDQVARSASAAQDSVKSFESEMRPRIQQNPWAAVGIACLVGFLFGKMS
jgi:ElaB/YqjD/DUF883 family membrane-anchored ribosome-binding protein